MIRIYKETGHIRDMYGTYTGHIRNIRKSGTTLTPFLVLSQGKERVVISSNKFSFMVPGEAGGEKRVGVVYTLIK